MLTADDRRLRYAAQSGGTLATRVDGRRAMWTPTGPQARRIARKDHRAHPTADGIARRNRATARADARTLQRAERQGRLRALIGRRPAARTRDPG
jgi:hypothetical protein